MFKSLYRCLSLTVHGSKKLSTWAKLNPSLKQQAHLDVHPEVQDALVAKKPVVALETALVTHGFPHPVNLELSLSLEEIVRSTGCIPATIGIIGGRVKIGLQPSELERLADAKSNSSVAKISGRDIAPAIAMKADGGTTCSATLIFAALAGIKVFATGGLGGVHRGGENSMDVSADLQELTRCPVGLVSAGVKSILDIGRTLEYLETLGVPVLAYGRTRDFPAFFTPRSGFKVPWNVKDPAITANVLFTQWQLGMENGALIAVPIPKEYEAIGAAIQRAVDQAVAESEENGISKRGKEATPWLLSRIGALTKGESLVNNMALLKNTALVGGQIAVEYRKIEDEHGRRYLTNATSSFDKMRSLPLDRETNYPISLPQAKLIVMGSAAVDISAQTSLNTNKPSLHSTAPGFVSLSLGGVARNIAEACHRVMTSQSQNLASATLLISPVGSDTFGRLLVDQTQNLGMRTDGMLQSKKKTAVCNMILDSKGSLIGGVADMDITETLDGDFVLQQATKHKPSMLGLDGNLSPDTITQVVKYCHEHSITVFLLVPFPYRTWDIADIVRSEPTSVAKSTAILPAIKNSLEKYGRTKVPITFSFPNLLELAQMYQAARGDPLDLMAHPVWWSVIDDFSLGAGFRIDLERLARQNVSDHDVSKGTLSFLIDQGIAQKAVDLLPFFQHLVVKCGDLGILVVMRISGLGSTTPSWAQERSNPRERYIVAHGKSQEIVVLQHFPALAVETVVNVTGAGDSFVGTLLAHLVDRPNSFHCPKSLSHVISNAQHAAILTIQSHSAVSPLLSKPQSKRYI